MSALPCPRRAVVRALHAEPQERHLPLPPLVWKSRRPPTRLCRPSIPTSATAGASTITVTGKNFNSVQNLYIGTYKVTISTPRARPPRLALCRCCVSCRRHLHSCISKDLLTQFASIGGTLPVGSQGKIVLSTFANTKISRVMVSWPFNFSWMRVQAAKMRLMKADLVKIGL
jgi:hypothetical protein